MPGTIHPGTINPGKRKEVSGTIHPDFVSQNGTTRSLGLPYVSMSLTTTRDRNWSFSIGPAAKIGLSYSRTTGGELYSLAKVFHSSK